MHAGSGWKKAWVMSTLTVRPARVPLKVEAMKVGHRVAPASDKDVRPS
jgi:hypothetical protein